MLSFPSAVFAQGSIGFTASGLKGLVLNNPTSLQFGPDNRLYVSQQNGFIFAYSILRDGPGNYRVESTETINMIKSIPNHDDNGQPNTAVKDRQITGILVTGTADAPVLYVSSSDPRIGGGGTGGDKNLDTNSGMLSRIDRVNGKWIRTDVVLGLPRSEENHAVNGMQLDEQAQLLYLAVGGHTNAGSPSNNFAFLTEYALSAAILRIDLGRISREFGGTYLLPTLDDPDRANQPDGSDVNDPFGGNDGRNQAKIIPGGPVQIHSPGYRNAYDLVLTRTPGMEGRLYTIDNGANGGWGGHPDHEGAFGDPLTASVTNNYVIGEPGSSGPGPNDSKVNNKDNLHLVSAPDFPPIYGGHPAPVRANPSGAGLYWYDNLQAKAVFDPQPTVDWPPVPSSMADPVQGDFRNPGVNDGALYTWSASTNGLCEYTSTAFFNGALAGDLLAAAFDGTIYRIKLREDGRAVSLVEPLASGFGATPLDVTAQGPDQIFEGTVWAVTYGSDAVTVFEPEGTWEAVPIADGQPPVARADCGFVEVNGKFYLVGGYQTTRTDVFDPNQNSWEAGGNLPFAMHHFQPVVWQGKIYVMGAFQDNDSGGPEIPVSDIYIYDPETAVWSKGPAISRPRGAAGAVIVNNRIYLFGGLTNGHLNGWVSWVDRFDPASGEWTVLPDMPRERDHLQAGLIEGMVLLAGGRKTNASGDPFGETIPEVDVFNPVSESWETLPATANLPTQCAGASVVALNSELFVLGGESSTQSPALPTVQVFDLKAQAWRSSARMITGRAGTGVVAFQNALWIVAGSAVRGSSAPLVAMEKLQTSRTCVGDRNSLTLDDDGDGFSNGDETQNATNLCSSSSVPPDADGDQLSDLLDPDDDNDGLPDDSDPFAVDASNGLLTGLPIDYPLLNGDPGWGLFGMGFTGLMANGKTNYQELFDPNHPDLIMGGAVGIANIPAGSGNALTNAQQYAFQTGFRIAPADERITIKVLLQGPYFNSASGNALIAQEHGFYLGMGDQDNYLTMVLAANGGNAGFRIYGESGGSVFTNNMLPVAGILSGESLLLTAELDKATREVRLFYQIGQTAVATEAGRVILPETYQPILSGTQAMAVGLWANSGNAPSFAAAWDYIRVTSVRSNPPPQLSKVYTRLVNKQESEFTLDLAGLLGPAQSYELVTVGENPIVGSAEVSGRNLKLTLLPVKLGSANVQVRAVDTNLQTRDLAFRIQVVPPPAPVVRLNAGGAGYGTWSADNYYTGGTLYANAIPISGTSDDYLFQTERYSDKLDYAVPLTSGVYRVRLLFAEIYHGISNTKGTGTRIFDVSMEQKQVLNDYDILAAAGAPATAVAAMVDSVSVTDGFLNINFSAVKDKAKVSAIEILRYSLDYPPNSNPVVEHPGDRSYFEGAAVHIPVVASDFDAADSLSYQATGLPSPLQMDPSTGIISGSLEASIGIYPVAVLVSDNRGGTAQQEFSVEVLEPSKFHFRLNAGGSPMDFSGEKWMADNYFVGGSLFASGAGISNTSMSALYQSERYGQQFEYHIPVPGSARYEVILHFAEKYLSGSGLRSFSLDLESGAVVRSGLDIYALAGGAFRAYSEKLVAPVTDGVLNINFRAQLNQAMISAVEVVPCIEPAVGQINLSSTRICTGDSVTLTVNGVLNSAQNWVLYSGTTAAVPLASGTSGRFVVRPSVSTTYSIRPEGGCILPQNLRSAEITVDVPAVLSAASADKPTLCPGETSSIQVTGTLGSSDAWQLSGGSCGAPPIIQSSSGIFAVNPEETTTYFISATGGCSTNTSCLPVTVVRKSIQAGIRSEGSDLTSELDGTGYVWLDCSGNQILPGATAKTFSPGYSGSFMVQLIYEGCTITSDCREVLVTGLSKPDESARLFPNPAPDYLMVSPPENWSGGWLSLVDWSGRIIHRFQHESGDIRIDLSNMPSGIYILRFESSQGLRQFRFIH